ncbi:Shikimate dehydrogenase (NADP(+)) [Paraliobacillus ryukyuensis]|uniref:Shikimate dehydrogenase (NADP(+)) n=1 Tax=Paraliobacillus ryukyuensis TaxID=200904 RepID=A0A366EH52_9BACI|nr:shikimate dehydrogenase [Paraliobacillus ryukyuensis]RBP01326.1 shikimate dehydrogenase [Paraliobacillus ryukyuensis]
MKLGLVGNPIKHSLSPWIHKQFLQQVKQQGDYHLFETEENQFIATVAQLKQKKLTGFNITVPFKQKIIAHLDGLDANAEQIGAVNTVVNENGRWIGYNTDGLGYLEALMDAYSFLFSDNQKRVLVIGAGGAARGIFYTLCQHKFQTVDIANRTMNKAMELKLLNKSKVTKTTCLSFEEAEKQLGQYDLIVQTTSVGMNEDKKVLALDQLTKDTVVSDIVYQPLITTFLAEAQKRGAYIHQGHMMLLYQAKLAFQNWTNREVNVSPLLEDFEQQIKKDG